MIQCTFAEQIITEEISKMDGKEAVRQCTTDDQFTDIENCISAIDNMMPAIELLQNRLDLLLDGKPASNVEVTVRNDLQSDHAKEDLLGELCYNYFQVDSETQGCKVDRPIVTVFYETGSSEVQKAFEHFESLAAYAPFENLADFQFVPYGTTHFDADSGNYSCTSDEVCQANWIHVSFF